MLQFILTPRIQLTFVHQATGVLQKLRPGDFHVTVVSSDTFTTFTPLLPCECSFKCSLFSGTVVDPHPFDM